MVFRPHPHFSLSDKDLDARDWNGLSALHWAALKNYTGIAKLLIQHLTNINITQEAKNISTMRTPLALALQEGHQEMVQFLVEQDKIKLGYEGRGIYYLKRQCYTNINKQRKTLLPIAAFNTVVAQF